MNYESVVQAAKTSATAKVVSHNICECVCTAQTECDMQNVIEAILEAGWNAVILIDGHFYIANTMPARQSFCLTHAAEEFLLYFKFPLFDGMQIMHFKDGHLVA